MSRQRTPGDGPKCACGKPAVWSGYCQMEDGHGYCTSRQAMTKTTAEVKVGDKVLVEAEVIKAKPERDGYLDVKIYDHYYYAEDGSDLEDAEHLRLPIHQVHTDYATLQQRCEQLTECVRELVGEVDCTNAAHFHRRKPKVDKAKALIGVEKGVGT